LSENDREYGDILRHTEVLWLSSGTVMKLLESKVVTEVSDEKWFWGLDVAV
jgi:hypothetical protein